MKIAYLRPPVVVSAGLLVYVGKCCPVSMTFHFLDLGSAVETADADMEIWFAR